MIPVLARTFESAWARLGDVINPPGGAPSSYPCYISEPAPVKLERPPRYGLLTALVLLVLVPRVIMALRITTISPDGTLYVTMARALEHGDLQTALAIQLNIYPLILAALHQIGFDWVLAGKVWGVLVSTVAVLPLFGWARRQFDDRIAAVGCVLYATHPKLIECSPELIRDPTFWLLLATSVYLLWRAVTEVRVAFYALAGVGMALAILTRFEGNFLFILLLLWTAGRFLALTESRGRLVFGAVLCAAVLPILLSTASLILLGSNWNTDLYRLVPLDRVQNWLASWTISTSTTGYEGHMLWNFLDTMQRGLGAFYALLMFGGLWAWRREWARRDNQPLFYFAMAVTGGIWIHLSYMGQISSRYALSIVILAVPYTSLGLLSLLGLISRTIARFSSRAWLRVAVPAAVVLVIAAVSCGDALSNHYDSRESRAELGRWIRATYGPSQLLATSVDLSSVVVYYAEGRNYPIPADADDQELVSLLDNVRPDLILFTSEADVRRFQRVEEHYRHLEFVRVAPASIPGGWQHATLLARSRPAAKLAQNVVPTDGTK